MIVKTTFYLEDPIINKRFGPIEDLLTAIDFLKTNSNCRIVRRIERTEVIEEIVYPEGITTWK